MAERDEKKKPSLSEYYVQLGYEPQKWHIGPEHPFLENYAIRLLNKMPSARVLEIGYQSGGFAVPLILSQSGRPDFSYTGIDSLSYDNAVGPRIIAEHLLSLGMTDGYQFLTAESNSFLRQHCSSGYDLILVDHLKQWYPRELLTILSHDLIAAEGYVLLHDIAGRASAFEADCRRIALAYSYEWSTTDEVPEGLAVVKRSPKSRATSGHLRLRRCGAHIRTLARTLRNHLRLRSRLARFR